MYFQESGTLLKQKAGGKVEGTPEKGKEREESEKTDTLIVEEEMESGNIKASVVVYYVSVIGWPALLAFLFQLIFQGTHLLHS